MGWKWYVVALCLGTALALVQHWTTEGRQTPRPTKHAPTRPADDLPPQEPVLRIELGMHGAPIRRIGVDRACRLIVTGSADKTARLWDLPEGGAGTPRLNRVFRVPIGPGYNGKINAVALSPDGQIVAAGGFNRRGGDHWVYLFEASTGRTLRRLGPLGNVLFHLTFSPDGGHLAATLGGIEGVRIWETAG